MDILASLLSPETVKKCYQHFVLFRTLQTLFNVWLQINLKAIRSGCLCEEEWNCCQRDAEGKE